MGDEDRNFPKEMDGLEDSRRAMLDLLGNL